MAKPEWGTKRICLSCGARFYDFNRSPINCPACNAAFDLEAATRVRRSRAPGRVIPEDVVEKKKPVEADAAEDDAVEDDAAPELDEAEDAEAEAEDAEVVIEEEEEDDEPALIEDAADLGDDSDVADVIAEDIDDEDRNR